MGFGDSIEYFTNKLNSYIVLRDNDSVCNEFICAIGNWWFGE